VNVRLAWLLLFAGIAFAGGCAATERAAARDPMKCERNPQCASARGAYADCSEQCSYDPACTERCLEAAPDQPKH
jgi:hypothetical protein